MRTLKNYTLIYDKDCPMCRLYTGAFVKQGWLDTDGRVPFSEVSESNFEQLDIVRASNEIALVNRQTGEITYGLESLTSIVVHRLPFLKMVLKSRVVRWPLQHFYSFISYNRKVIAAVKPTGKPCNPSYHFGYRVAYLVLAFFVVSAALASYSHLMEGLLPKGNAASEYLVCGVQILFQSVVLSIMKRNKLMDYLGNMMTVSLIGVLALLPILMLRHWLQIPPHFAAGWFLMVAGGMLLEHIRRMKLLELDWMPSVTWVFYRGLVLLLIFIL